MSKHTNKDNDLAESLVALDQARRNRDQVNAWVERAKSGDVPAFEAIYRHFERRIYALCLRMSANQALAEELMQEAFVLAWRKIDMFHGDSQFGTWLYRLTSNLVISHFRSLKNRPFEELEQDSLGGHDEGAQLDLNRDLEQAIAELPAKARVVLVLHDIEGYKHCEIAQQLSVSEGTCKAQLHRARQILKKRFL